MTERNIARRRTETSLVYIDPDEAAEMFPPPESDSSNERQD